jgi:hypothetical protein
LAAWDNWVRALVRRYKGRVHAWEVWNEPDLGKATGPQDYARLFIRTAQLIRNEQPRARIYALALAGNLKFAEEFLSHVVHQRKLELIDALTIHGYPRDPDETTNIDRLRAIIARFGRPIEVRQGETGAPSKYQENFALSKLPWSELTQAKWNLRRMLAHRGKDVPFNLFTISDMHYRQKGKLQMNYKGLLETNPDQTIARPKQAYFAAQHVFTIFDDQLVRCTNFWCQPDVARPIAAYAYSNTNFNASLVSLWFNDRPPAETNAMVFVNLTFQGVKFREPVYADLLTGCVYALPLQGEGFSFKDLPLYDSPILIAEKRALPLNPLPDAHAQPPSAATGSPVICGRLHP